MTIVPLLCSSSPPHSETFPQLFHFLRSQLAPNTRFRELVSEKYLLRHFAMLKHFYNEKPRCENIKIK